MFTMPRDSSSQGLNHQIQNDKKTQTDDPCLTFLWYHLPKHPIKSDQSNYLRSWKVRDKMGGGMVTVWS